MNDEGKYECKKCINLTFPLKHIINKLDIQITLNFFSVPIIDYVNISEKIT